MAAGAPGAAGPMANPVPLDANNWVSKKCVLTFRVPISLKASPSLLLKFLSSTGPCAGRASAHVRCSDRGRGGPALHEPTSLCASAGWIRTRYRGSLRRACAARPCSGPPIPCAQYALCQCRIPQPHGPAASSPACRSGRRARFSEPRIRQHDIPSAAAPGGAACRCSSGGRWSGRRWCGSACACGASSRREHCVLNICVLRVKPWNSAFTQDPPAPASSSAAAATGSGCPPVAASSRCAWSCSSEGRRSMSCSRAPSSSSSPTRRSEQ